MSVSGKDNLDAITARFSWLMIGRKTIFDRLRVWLCEFIGAAVLVALFLSLYGSIGARSEGEKIPFWTPFAVMLLALPTIFLVFTTTGYILTTAIIRVFWNVNNAWSYPLLAAFLFVIHSQIAVRGIDPKPEWGWMLDLIGAPSIFGITWVGNRILARNHSLHATCITMEA